MSRRPPKNNFNAGSSGPAPTVTRTPSNFLLDHGADLRAPANRGGTGLHWAVGGGYLGIVRLLLARGAPLEAINQWGGSPLDYGLWAFANGDPGIDFVPVFETLLAAGAKIPNGSLEWLEKQPG